MILYGSSMFQHISLLRSWVVGFAALSIDIRLLRS